MPERPGGERVLVLAAVHPIEHRIRDRVRQSTPPKSLRRPSPTVAPRLEPACELTCKLRVVEVAEPQRLVDRSCRLVRRDSARASFTSISATD